MSEATKHGHGLDGFERQDMSAQSVYGFLISLAVGGVLVYFVIWGLFHFMDARSRARQPRLGPLVKQVETDTRKVSPDEITRFPQPRLEQNERVEIYDFRLQEEQKLNSYGWVDEKAGVVRIPIERAMQLLVERGLPTTPRIGAAPSSSANVASQAAERADTSQKNSPRKPKLPK